MAKKKLCTYTKKVIICVYWLKKYKYNTHNQFSHDFTVIKMKKNKKQNEEEKKKLTMNHL